MSNRLYGWDFWNGMPNVIGPPGGGPLYRYKGEEMVARTGTQCDYCHVKEDHDGIFLTKSGNLWICPSCWKATGRGDSKREEEKREAHVKPA